MGWGAGRVKRKSKQRKEAKGGGWIFRGYLCVYFACGDAVATYCSELGAVARSEPKWSSYKLGAGRGQQSYYYE